MTQLKALLLSREAKGLRVPLAARMVLIGFGIINTIVGVLFTDAPGTSPTLNVLVFGTFSIALFVNIRLMFWLKQARHIERAGLIGAGFDGVMVLALSGLAQLAGAQDGLSVGYVFKTEMPITVLAFVAINGLALRARYPLIVGAAALVALIVPAVRLARDPETLWTADRALVYGAGGHDLSSVITIIIMAAGVITAVCFAAHAARQTIRAAITQELEHARQQQEHLQLVMKEKVGAIARLVAGICHEVNTPVGALQSGVDTQARVLERLAGAAPDDPKMGKLLRVGQQSLGAMQSAAERLAKLEASLRALSHLDEADFRKVDVHEELAKVLEVVQRPPAVTTTVRTEFAALPQIYVAASEFNQALLTLVSFAFEAAGPSGTVSIQTMRSPGAVQIEILDDGPGLSVEALAGLFDISLSSQGERVAAGLALATAQSVVQRHGGALSATHGDDGGTCLHIELPFGDEASA